MYTFSLTVNRIVETLYYYYYYKDPLMNEYYIRALYKYTYIPKSIILLEFPIRLIVSRFWSFPNRNYIFIYKTNAQHMMMIIMVAEQENCP